MMDKTFWIFCLLLIDLGIYLFVSAPPPLPDTHVPPARIPVTAMFELLEHHNDAIRSLWTVEIVGAGKKVGLEFDEHWRDDDVEAGPLPALFLRETARALERRPVPLSLFLGSDYPINPANRFRDAQLARFQKLKRTRQPVFFVLPDLQRQVAMFPDLAVSRVCIDCHNHHQDSPKTDWRLDEVMGATTWMYPASRLSLEELVKVVATLHEAVREAYESYLDKARAFSRIPAIGEHWPREGYFLPDSDTFMEEVRRMTGPLTLLTLMELVSGSTEEGAGEHP